MDKCLSVEVPKTLNSIEFMTVWKEWVIHRLAGKKKASMPEEMFRRQLANLEKWCDGEPSAAIAILETSMANGWQGIFEPKNRAETNGKATKPIWKDW